MKIAVVHSFYASGSSGENSSVLAEIDVLQEEGHDVTLVAASGRDNAGAVPSIRAACRVLTGRGKSPAALISRLSPDVVHLHNLFPSWSTAWVAECSAPLVATLHNYRGVCANGLFLREGRFCQDCASGSALSGLRHGCYRKSRLATLPLTGAQVLRGLEDPYFAVPRLLLLPSAMAARLYSAAGLAPNRIRVHEPFLPEKYVAAASGGDDRHGIVYVGRLSPEKGLQDILPTWSAEVPLTVVGDGPLQRELQLLAPSSVNFVGDVERELVISYLKSAEAAIFPSRAVETFGLVYLEALAVGTPVIAREGTVAGSLVTDEKTGVTVSDWNHLDETLAQIRSRGRELRDHCLRTFRARYSQRSWVIRANEAYADALAPMSEDRALAVVDA